MNDYKLKYKNTDFMVNEVSLMPTLSIKNNSQYSYIWMVKNGLTTFDATEKIAKFFNIDISEINTQGLKDEDAVTKQIVSIKKIIDSKHLLEFNKKHVGKYPEIKIDKIIGYGKINVTERALHGNIFNITIRNLNPETAEKIKSFCTKNRFITFINYYDNQRFGMPGGPYNTHLIGEAIVKNDWKKAFEEIIKTNNFSEAVDYSSKIKDDDFIKDYFKKMNIKKIKFFVAAYTSFLWNKKVSTSIKKLNSESKKCYFEEVGNLFVPTKLPIISKNILTVPGFEFSEKSFCATAKNYSRTMSVSTTVFPSGLETDEYNNRKKRIVLSFFLPTGTYATMFVKQLLLQI
jgi:tRNA pseudouridine13 synthase